MGLRQFSLDLIALGLTYPLVLWFTKLYAFPTCCVPLWRFHLRLVGWPLDFSLIQTSLEAIQFSPLRAHHRTTPVLQIAVCKKPFAISIVDRLIEAGAYVNAKLGGSAKVLDGLSEDEKQQILACVGKVAQREAQRKARKEAISKASLINGDDIWGRAVLGEVIGTVIPGVGTIAGAVIGAASSPIHAAYIKFKNMFSD